MTTPVARVLSAPWRALVWALDLDDGRGNPAFSKLVTLVLLAVAVRMLWGVTPDKLTVVSLLFVVALLAVSLGRSVFLRYLDRFKGGQ